MLDFPDAPTLGEFAHSRVWDGGKWIDEENHWVVSGYPIGAMLDWPRETVPRYWTWADGREVSRAGYPALFAQIGEDFGDGDGSTTFNLPDTRSRVTVGAFVLGRAGGDQRVGAHTHPVTDNGHNHGFNDPGHAHSLAQNNHAHNVPDPAHAHGLPQSPHDHGIGDPSHNHGIHDPTHNHTQDHSWGYWLPSLEGGVADANSIITDWNFSVDYNWSGLWNDANWTGVWWYGEYAWVGMHGAGTGVWMDAADAGVSYNSSGVALTVNASTAGTVTVSLSGGGIAANVQPSMIAGKIIYTGVP